MELEAMIRVKGIVSRIRKCVFNFFISNLKPCNRTMSIKRGVLIYLNDNEKIKDQSPRYCSLAVARNLVL